MNAGFGSEPRSRVNELVGTGRVRRHGAGGGVSGGGRKATEALDAVMLRGRRAERSRAPLLARGSSRASDGLSCMPGSGRCSSAAASYPRYASSPALRALEGFPSCSEMMSRVAFGGLRARASGRGAVGRGAYGRPPGSSVVHGSPVSGSAHVSRETPSLWGHACGSVRFEHPGGKDSLPCCESCSGSRCGHRERGRPQSTSRAGVRIALRYEFHGEHRSPEPRGPVVRPIAPEGGARRDVRSVRIGSVGRARHVAPIAGWHADRPARWGFPEAGMFHVKRCRSPAARGAFGRGAQIVCGLVRLPASGSAPVVAGGCRRESLMHGGGRAAIVSSRSRYAGGCSLRSEPRAHGGDPVSRSRDRSGGFVLSVWPRRAGTPRMWMWNARCEAYGHRSRELLWALDDVVRRSRVCTRSMRGACVLGGLEARND